MGKRSKRRKKKIGKPIIKAAEERNQKLATVKAYIYFAFIGIYYIIRLFLYESFVIFNKVTLKEKIQMIFCYFLPCGYITLLFAKLCIGNILLRSYGVTTQAVVTSTITESIRRSSRAYYLYEFEYDGKKYRGSSLIKEKEEDRIGDSVNVVFLEFLPNCSRQSEYFD